MKIETPGGVLLDLEIEEIASGEMWASCAVRKDGGDDPDVTSGCLVYSRISREPGDGKNGNHVKVVAMNMRMGESICFDRWSGGRNSYKGGT